MWFGVGLEELVVELSAPQFSLSAGWIVAGTEVPLHQYLRLAGFGRLPGRPLKQLLK